MIGDSMETMESKRDFNTQPVATEVEDDHEVPLEMRGLALGIGAVRAETLGSVSNGNKDANNQYYWGTSLEKTNDGAEREL
jgi:hypothetical protein